MVMAMAAGLFASCSTEGSWEAYDLTSETQYSFEQKSVAYEITPENFMPQIVVNVFRSNAKGNVTVPVEVKLNNNIMTYDTAAVIFKNGEANTQFILNVDEANFKGGKKYTAELAFVVDSVNFFEHNYSLTGNAKTSISLQMPYTWESIGKAVYTDDVVTTFFGLPQIVSYEVEAERALESEGVIRLKNVYGAAYPYNEPGDYDTKKDYYVQINCEDPTAVYIDGRCDTGMNWGYGNFIFTSYAWYLLDKGNPFDAVKEAGLFGTLDENLCITFPAGAVLVGMAEYNNGGLYQGNKNGMFKVDLSTTTLAE